MPPVRRRITAGAERSRRGVEGEGGRDEGQGRVHETVSWAFKVRIAGGERVGGSWSWRVRGLTTTRVRKGKGQGWA